MTDKKKEKLISMNEVLQKRMLDPIALSPQTLLKWVKKDLEGKNLMGVVVVKNEGRGHRYWFNQKGIEEFLRAFKNQELSDEYEGQ